MNLRDRMRRWWRPAQWDDDHPAERKHRAHSKKGALHGWLAGNPDDVTVDVPTVNVDRAFKKPR